jgi:hypothetical protein
VKLRASACASGSSSGGRHRRPGPRPGISRLRAAASRSSVFGPVGIGLVHQAQVQKPFAGVVDDIEVQHPRPAQPANQPEGRVRNDSRSSEIERVAVGQRGSSPVMRPGAFVVEARQGVVGLRLQMDGLDPALGAARSCGIRPRASRLATRPVMNTVLPARDRPVTPSRRRGSKNRPDRPACTPSRLRAMPSVMPVPRPFPLCGAHGRGGWKGGAPSLRLRLLLDKEDRRGGKGLVVAFGGQRGGALVAGGGQARHGLSGGPCRAMP